MGLQLELVVLLALSVIGQGTFSVFEVETLVLPLGLAAAGLTFHVVWCRRNGIDPLTATPRRRYYELRGWRWSE